LAGAGGKSGFVPGLSKEVVGILEEMRVLEEVSLKEGNIDMEVACKEVAVDEDKEEEKDEEDDGVGFGSLFDSESQSNSTKNSNTPSTSSNLPPPRNLKIPSSWTGKSSKTLLQENVNKRVRQAKLKYSKSIVNEGGYVASLAIEGAGVNSSSLGGAPLVYSLDLSERVDNFKMAEELVAVRESKSVLFSSPSQNQV
jgi:hypothetical protein